MLSTETLAAIVHEAGSEYWQQVRGPLEIQAIAWANLDEVRREAVRSFVSHHLRNTCAVPGDWRCGNDLPENFHDWPEVRQAAEQLACGIVDALRDFVDPAEIEAIRA